MLIQRFEDGLDNYRRACHKFSEAVTRREEIYREGFGDIYLDLVVKRFEFTFDTSCRAIKRYLNFIGMDCPNPRGCFKEGYVQRVIADEAIWLDMIEQRNLTSHVYNESEVAEILGKIDRYRLAFQQLLDTLEARLREE
jgi:nucleotidyltransferase substrate binding protein (TIGR01987 family)